MENIYLSKRKRAENQNCLKIFQDCHDWATNRAAAWHGVQVDRTSEGAWGSRFRNRPGASRGRQEAARHRSEAGGKSYAHRIWEIGVTTRGWAAKAEGGNWGRYTLLQRGQTNVAEISGTLNANKLNSLVPQFDKLGALGCQSSVIVLGIPSCSPSITPTLFPLMSKN